MRLITLTDCLALYYQTANKALDVSIYFVQQYTLLVQAIVENVLHIFVLIHSLNYTLCS